MEDEEPIRRSAGRALERFGYTVLMAVDGREALDLLEKGHAVDLVVTDVVMPRLSGRKLYDAVRGQGASTRFLFTSGHTTRDVRERAELDPAVPFLPKPWPVTTLLNEVRSVLDGRAA